MLATAQQVDAGQRELGTFALARDEELIAYHRATERKDEVAQLSLLAHRRVQRRNMQRGIAFAGDLHMVDLCAAANHESERRVDLIIELMRTLVALHHGH